MVLADENFTVIAEAEKLAEDLEGLPIALDQAGAYVKATKIGFSGYRDLLNRDFEVPKEEYYGRSQLRYDQGPFYRTWEISFESISDQERYPNASEILLLCAFLDKVDIGEDLLRQAKIYGMPSKLQRYVYYVQYQS
jgi:hypothetical protein